MRGDNKKNKKIKIKIKIKRSEWLHYAPDGGQKLPVCTRDANCCNSGNVRRIRKANIEAVGIVDEVPRGANNVVESSICESPRIRFVRQSLVSTRVWPWFSPDALVLKEISFMQRTSGGESYPQVGKISTEWRGVNQARVFYCMSRVYG